MNAKDLLDKIHLQKYIYLIKCFLSSEIEVPVFVEYFLRIRRDDTYWLTSSFDDSISRIMDSTFLDIDEYNPEDLYDLNNKFNINEDELRIRLKNALSQLDSLLES